MRIAILDGYIDEPASLGVPPFISPVVRSILGAIFTARPKIKPEDVNYLTIDDWRKGRNPGEFHPQRAELLILVSNIQVPGKYLGGTPASARELSDLCSNATGEVHSWKMKIKGAAPIPEEPDLFIHQYLTQGGPPTQTPGIKKTPEQWRNFALEGAKHLNIILNSGSYSQNYAMCELETFKGCPRQKGCSFCPEWRRALATRPPEDIVAEVDELTKAGVSRFRLGGSCFFSYLSEETGKSDVPTPNVKALTRLLKELAAKKPKVLHIDNANPAVLAEHPEEATKVARALVKYATPGNLASFGLESADPAVLETNNINSSPQQVLEAVRLLNDVGKKRGKNGLPAFLPGLNLLYGLPGETPETFSHNFEFLKTILNEGLMLRRINIRQVNYDSLLAFGDSFNEDAKSASKLANKHRSSFMGYKRRTRNEIDRPMLERVFPVGTVLRDVYLEKLEGKTAFGRQLGTYPILVGIPYPLELGTFVDVKITEHGFRSVTGISHPFYLNRASFTQLQALPGLGKKRGARLFRELPLKNITELEDALDDKTVARRLLEEKWLRLDAP